jgi:hypothetical protein
MDPSHDFPHPSWRPIQEFNGEMFCLLSSGLPESYTVLKYKGDIPSWAKFWMPIPPIPREVRKKAYEAFDDLQ